MKALTDEESDAMEQKFPCYVHGMLKMEAFSGALRPDEQSGQITPSTYRPSGGPTKPASRCATRPRSPAPWSTRWPYLVDYPYGCTEQTLNRFLPTVITQKILLDMNLDLDAVRQKRTNLNAQELGDAQQRAEQWKRYESVTPSSIRPKSAAWSRKASRL